MRGPHTFYSYGWVPNYSYMAGVASEWCSRYSKLAVAVPSDPVPGALDSINIHVDSTWELVRAALVQSIYMCLKVWVKRVLGPPPAPSRARVKVMHHGLSPASTSQHQLSRSVKQAHHQNPCRFFVTTAIGPSSSQRRVRSASHDLRSTESHVRVWRVADELTTAGAVVPA
jgi:hypothetical protein